MGMRWERTEGDVIEVYEQMLYQRAAYGIRPVLYISSFTDFECSRLMLLDKPSENNSSGPQRPISEGERYDLGTS